MGKAIFIAIFGVFLAGNQNLRSQTASFRFVEEGTLDNISKIYPNASLPFSSIYGIDQIQFSYYSPDLVFSSKYKKTVLITDPTKNIIGYSIDEIDFDTYGGKEGEDTFQGISLIKACPDGSVFVADAGNNRVVKVYFNGSILVQTEKVLLGVQNPAGLAVDLKQKRLFIADTGNNRVLKTDFLFTPANSFSGANSFGDSGLAAQRLLSPKGICVAENGSIYVGDTGNQRVCLFSPEGKLITSKSYSDLGLSSLIINDMVLDKFGSIYAVEQGSQSLLKFHTNLTLLAQVGGAGSGDYNLNSPKSVSIYKENGGIFVTVDGGAKGFRQTPGLNISSTTPSVFSPYSRLKPNSVTGYSISSASLVNVIVKDSQYQLIRFLKKNEFSPIGENQVAWDGLDGSGKKSSEGNYWIQVVANVAVENVSPADFNAQKFNSALFNSYFANGFGEEKQVLVNITHPPTVNFDSVTPRGITSADSSVKVKYGLPKEAFIDLCIVGSKYSTSNTFDPDVQIVKKLQKNIASQIRSAPGTYFISWDGQNESSSSVSDGVYFLKGRAVSLSGDEGESDTFRLGVDRTPVKIVPLENPRSFAPRIFELTYRFKLNEAAFVSVSVKNKSGIVIKQIKNRELLFVGENNFKWNGLDDGNRFAREGDYSFEIMAEDLTGLSMDRITVSQ